MTNSISAVIPEVITRNNLAITTSMSVANYFQKSHDDIMKRIRAVMFGCPPSYHVVNFNKVNHEAGIMRKMPMFELTRDAFMLIVMVFTGKRAARLKEAYIAKFNAMEVELSHRPAAPVVPAGVDLDLLVHIRNGVPESSEVVKAGHLLIHPDSAVEIMRRAGSIVIYHQDLADMPAWKITALCEDTRKEEARWAKAPV